MKKGGEMDGWVLLVFLSAGAVMQAASADCCRLPQSSDIPRLSTDVVDILPPGHHSSALETLFNQARTAAKRPIRFGEYLSDSRKPTSLVEAAINEYVIGLRQGMNSELTENAIAHELMHIILQNNGFAARVDVPDGASQWMKQVGFTITSCVDDAVIDRRMAALGFRPEVLNRDAVEKIRSNPPTDQIPLLREKVYADGTALTILCFSFRKRNDGDEIESTWASVNPEIVDRAHSLAHRIGDTSCDDAAGCTAKKLQIRDVLGYPIKFCNPLTGKFE